jgi:hypothetical protein
MYPHAHIRSLLMKPLPFGTPKKGAAASLGAARQEAV